MTTSNARPESTTAPDPIYSHDLDSLPGICPGCGADLDGTSWEIDWDACPLFDTYCPACHARVVAYTRSVAVYYEPHAPIALPAEEVTP